ncbi:TetR/AcrR family transcriptional regulator [Polaromonas sp.]|uniref:TetR/AcrR family transcriptional regulator n=1 Tax=Polaromonas sp. TaxID=1869339 RepID=UPI0032636EEC
MEAKTKKSELTRSAIIEAGLEMAISHGFGAVTVPSLAEKLQLSNSGVFSRIGSIEALRTALVEEYTKRFLGEIFFPAMEQPRGIDRLNAMVERWIHKICSSSGNNVTLFEVTAFSNEPAAQSLRGTILTNVRAWRSAMEYTIQQGMEKGQFRDDADASALLFEIHCLVVGVLYEYRVLDDPSSAEKAICAYRALIERFKRPVASA